MHQFSTQSKQKKKLAEGWTRQQIQPILDRNNLVYLRDADNGKSIVVYHKDDKTKKEETLPLPTSKNILKVSHRN